jgi:uncharacterized protein (DUF924 family)
MMTMAQSSDPGDVVSFWLAQDKKAWFSANPTFDAEVWHRFADLLDQAKSGNIDHWAESPKGALALVILLDQMSRNIYRDRPEMYAADGKALAIAESAIAQGFDEALAANERAWLYMPFMHSEDLEDQEKSIALFSRSGLSENLPFAIHHADIIRRFGRFPHRNAILGRHTTPEEAAFLAGGGFSGVASQQPEDQQD